MKLVCSQGEGISGLSVEKVVHHHGGGAEGDGGGDHDAQADLVYLEPVMMRRSLTCCWS